MSSLLKKNFDQGGEESRPAKKITVSTVQVNGKNLQRVTALSGWKWSVDLKPVVKTDTCQMDHLLYMISGRMMVQMDYGQKLECVPGEIVSIPPGHDGWGIGSEPTIWLEIPH